jgi:hypothetical protein
MGLGRADSVRVQSCLPATQPWAGLLILKQAQDVAGPSHLPRTLGRRHCPWVAEQAPSSDMEWEHHLKRLMGP